MNDLEKKLHSLPQHQQVWVKNLISHIRQANNTTDLSIRQLARRFMMSERQFYRKVKQNLGLTPNQLIRTIKMQKAKELLEKGTYATIAELAHILGYKQPEYFSNLFVEAYGKRPSHYLKN